MVPLDRTDTPYLLTDALGDLTLTSKNLRRRISPRRSTSSATPSTRPRPTWGPPSTGCPVLGTIASRDELIRGLLDNAESVTSVLSDRSTQINRMLLDGGALFSALAARRDDVDTLLTGITAVTRQISALIDENDAQLGPALTELNRVAELLDKHRKDLQASLKPLQQYATSLGESVASGPFFNAYVMNLLPGNSCSRSSTPPSRKRASTSANWARPPTR